MGDQDGDHFSAAFMPWIGAIKRETDSKGQAGITRFIVDVRTICGRLRLLSRLLTPQLSFIIKCMVTIDNVFAWETMPAEWQLRPCRKILAVPLKEVQEQMPSWVLWHRHAALEHLICSIGTCGMFL